MNNSNQETGLVAVATTLLLSVASLFFNTVGLRAQDCSDVGEGIGESCSGHPQGCTYCIGGPCGLLAEDDTECYATCWAAASAACS